MLSKTEFDAIKSADSYDAYRSAMRSTNRRYTAVTVAVCALIAVGFGIAAKQQNDTWAQIHANDTK